MYAKSVIATTLLVILCIKLGQGLECYSHAPCVDSKCPDLSTTNKTCAKDETKCWKASVPGGTVRGCGDNQCKVEISVGSAANVCCSTDLCNSAIQIPITTVVMVLMILIAVINRSYFG